MTPPSPRDEHRRDLRRRLYDALTRWPPTVGQLLFFSILLNLLLAAAIAVAVLAAAADDCLTDDELRALSDQFKQMQLQTARDAIYPPTATGK